RFVEQFARLSDPYLRERAVDMRTLGQRLLFHLDDTISGPSSWPERFILVADELTATLLAELPQERLVGVVVREGAANSHAAIMVRALGIPMVMGVDILPSLLHQRLLIVDGHSGELLVDPEPILVREYQRRVNQEQQLTRLAEDDIDQPALLSSGERITILLNAGLSMEHEQLLNAQVDGVGLYRTELPFMLQSGFPSEEEQVIHYREMLTLFPDRPVTLRTLDIGADKQLPYMPLNEENPSLGWRGIRITLDQPDLFMAQVRAMLRAHADTGNLQILLPMVTSVEEIDSARTLLDRAWNEVCEMLQQPVVRPPLGIMLEVPSMLFLIDHLPGRVDFISVGSNDLTQYLLAVDRNNTRVAALYDGLHPAVLHGLQHIIQAAGLVNLPVSLCGEMAGDPISVLLLIGMGYRSLSMNSRNVARIKYLLRRFDLQELEILSKQVFQEPFVATARKRVIDFMEQRGLSGLVRAGMSTLAV
ncbi:MAG: phosphoenolpyruvate--protein phosphotransferase, partial [Enterobacteriaceae bacterium]